VVPILEPRLRDRLVRLLETALEDNDLAWELDSEGTCRRPQPQPGEERVNLHERLVDETRTRRTLMARGVAAD
jgi:polyphosphate kinase